MKIRRKTRVLALAALAIAAMLLLVNGLNGLTLKPGRSLFFGADFIFAPGEAQYLPGGELILWFIRVVFGLAWIGLPLMVIYLIVSAEARRKMLRFLKRTLPPLIVLFTLAKIAQILLSGRSLAEAISPGAGAGGQDLSTEGLEPFSGQPPEWLVILSSLLVAGLVLALAVMLVNSRRRKKAGETPVARIAREAQQALDEINAGADLGGTIIRCYHDMAAVILEQRGLARDRAMTAHEFEAFLSEKGLPFEPLHTLTRLFEDVRYGGIRPGEREERRAVDSLTAIVAACGGQQ
jgi:hypothetical protein